VNYEAYSWYNAVQSYQQLLAALDDLGASTFASLTLSQCTTVAASISALGPTDSSLTACTNVLLDTATWRMSQGMSLGPVGAAAAVDTASAVMGLLAQPEVLIHLQTAKRSIHQSSAVIRAAVTSLVPLDLASILCAPSAACLH
jgi:hypothetical protein